MAQKGETGNKGRAEGVSLEDLQAVAARFMEDEGYK